MADTRINNIISAETARAQAAEADLDTRIQALESVPVYASNENNAQLNQNLANWVDNAGNLLGYFDKSGNFYINGNIHANNI